MTLPTEPSGSIPRSSEVVSAIMVAEEVRERVLAAARYIPIVRLATTDDCGLSSPCDDTALASVALGVG